MAEKKGYDKLFTPAVRNTGKPLTNILERIKEAAARKGQIIHHLLTAKEAWDILIWNTNNRPIKNSTIAYYASEMAAGRWQYTSDSRIIIDWNFKLLNAQQRLLAQIKEGISLYWDISPGWDPETYKVLDRARNRTAGDTIALVPGVDDPNKVAAAAKFVISLMDHNKISGSTRTHIVSDDNLLEWMRDDKRKTRMVECAATATELVKEGRWLSHMLWASMLYYLGTYRKADAEEFITRLAKGEELSTTKNSTIFYLRKELEQWGDKMKDIGRYRNNFLRVHTIVSYWNYYVQKDNKGNPIEIPQKLRVEKNATELPKPRRS